MENYVISDVMCPGTFGTILFVVGRDSSQEYTVKKIECLDEGRANEALREALCLQQLSHPNIVKHREMFVSWDKNISSVILSTVMDCPYTTTLSTIINSRRQQTRRFTYKVIQTFLGQMVDALAFLHSRNIVHRNIKPSNILMVRGPTFRLFDFVTATITGDRIKLQKRIKESTKQWMAPEAVQQQWSAKSDVWSLGCVLFDMLTCHVCDMETSQTELHRIKQNSSPLDVVTSKELRPLLAMMFIPQSQDRANIWDVANVDLVRRCLLLCGTPLYAMKKILPLGVTGPPFSEGFDQALGMLRASVLHFMLNYTDVRTVQISVLSYLLEGTENVPLRVNHVVTAVTSAMMNHPDCADIQLKACQVLQQHLQAIRACGGDDSCLCDREVIAQALLAAANFPQRSDLLTQAFELLHLISGNETAAGVIEGLGGVQEAVKTLDVHQDHRDIVLTCSKFLYSTLASARTSAGGPVSGSVETMCLVGKRYLLDGAVTEHVCAALQSLASRGISEDEDIEECALLLMHALREQMTHCSVVKLTFTAMTHLARGSEQAAFRLLLTPSGKSGITLIKDAQLQHPEVPEVTEKLCGLLNVLAQHDDVVPELIAENVHELLRQIVTQHPSNEEAVQLAEQALLKVRSHHGDDDETTGSEHNQ